MMYLGSFSVFIVFLAFEEGHDRGKKRVFFRLSETFGDRFRRSFWEFFQKIFSRSFWRFFLLQGLFWYCCDLITVFKGFRGHGFRDVWL